MQKAILVALASLSAGAAAAEHAAHPHPADPKVRVPAHEYRSVFEDYRRFAEPELAPWRTVNEEVGRVGGHMGVLRAASEDEGKKPPASKGGGQGGHK